jgi:hypothetical protein
MSPQNWEARQFGPLPVVLCSLFFLFALTLSDKVASPNALRETVMPDWTVERKCVGLLAFSRWECSSAMSVHGLNEDDPLKSKG